MTASPTTPVYSRARPVLNASYSTTDPIVSEEQRINGAGAGKLVVYVLSTVDGQLLVEGRLEMAPDTWVELDDAWGVTAGEIRSVTIYNPTRNYRVTFTPNDAAEGTVKAEAEAFVA